MSAKKNIPPETYFQAWVEAGYNHAKAADKMGVTATAMQYGVRRYKRLTGDTSLKPAYIPPQQAQAHSQAPDGYTVKGVSTLVDAQGNVTAQWIKTQKDVEERINALIKVIKEEFAGVDRVPLIAAPVSVLEDLLTMYPIGDQHVGLHSWGEETGEDYDLKIAEFDLTSAVKRLVRSSPKSATGLIVNLGDFIHVDDGTNRTPAHGNVLDADSRYVKIVRVAVRTLKTCIDLALRRHHKVKIINARGNHDPHSAIVLTIALGEYYANNPRVEVEQSSATFIYHEFGKNLIGVTHGNTCKPEKLQGVMSSDRAEEWGRTKFRTWLTGHIHTRRVFELEGCTVETFRTLAARDGYATSYGYRSGRDMHAIVLHKEFGEIERHRVDISMLRAA